MSYRQACRSAIDRAFLLSSILAVSFLVSSVAGAQSRRGAPPTSATPPADPTPGYAIVTQTEGDDERARGLFLAGNAAFDRGEFEEALGFFEGAYDLSHRPELLFNIGAAAQRSRHRERALEAFRAYLAAIPEAYNRIDVETRIRDLEELLASGEDDAEADAGADADATETGPSGGPTEPATATPSRVAPRVLAIVGSALAATGIALVGVAIADTHAVENPDAGTHWSEVDGRYRRGPLLMGIGVASTVIGAAGIGTGVALLVSRRSDAEPTSTTSVVLSVRGAF